MTSVVILTSQAWSLSAYIILLSIPQLLCSPVPALQVTMLPAQKRMHCLMSHFPVASQLGAQPTELHCQHFPHSAYTARRCSRNIFSAPRKAVELPFPATHPIKTWQKEPFSHMQWEQGSYN